MAAPVSESELFLIGALAAKANAPEVAAATSKEVAKIAAQEAAAIATAEPAKADPPVEPAASSTSATTNILALATTPITSPVVTLDPRPRQPWFPKNRNLCDVPDPLICPGMNRDCFHAVISDAGYWDHVARKHHYTRKQMDKEGNEAVRDIFLPPHRASWFVNRGVDITYQGSEPKQIAARKRMAMGLKSTDPGYAEAVYGSTFGKPDV